MDNFSNLMMIGECLLDKKRTEAFKKAIDQTIKHGDIVLDAGTGSGILAMLAAKAGASKVFAVEIDKDISNFAKRNVELNGLSNIVEVINGDLKQIELPHLDAVIMEMMDTGLIAEQQVPAMNRLIEIQSVTENTKVIPNFYETYLQFCNYDFNFYGCEMPFIIQARNFGVQERIISKLSSKILISDINLKKKNNLHVLCNKTTEAVGLINAFILTSKIRLSNDIFLEGTTDMNMPVIVPVNPIKVIKGDLLKFEVKYELAKGFQSIVFNWR